MISVLLTLLKIIGIVLLSLLGLFLVLLLIILFVPVRYRLKGYYKDEFVCHGKITWLLHMVSVSIDYDKEAVTAVKILGIDISSFLNKKKEKSPQTSDNESANTKETHIPSTDNLKPEKSSAETSGNEKSTEEPVKTEANSETDNDTSKSRSLYAKIQDFFKRIKEKILSLYHKICEIIHNIKTKKDSLERYIRILQREEVKNSFSLCKKRIFKMIGHVLPKKMKIHAHIGMEDPAATGYILAAYSVFPEKKKRQIILKADFEKVIMEGDFIIKGSLHAYKYLYHILSVIVNKDCRTFYTLVKKEISNERQ